MILNGYVAFSTLPACMARRFWRWLSLAVAWHGRTMERLGLFSLGLRPLELSVFMGRLRGALMDMDRRLL